MALWLGGESLKLLLGNRPRPLDFCAAPAPAAVGSGVPGELAQLLLHHGPDYLVIHRHGATCLELSAPAASRRQAFNAPYTAEIARGVGIEQVHGLHGVAEGLLLACRRRLK